MVFCASGCRLHGGYAVRRRLLGLYVLMVLLLPVGCAGTNEEAKESGKSSPVTLLTVLLGTCHEIQSYVESLVGTSVVRSVTEVHT